VSGRATSRRMDRWKGVRSRLAPVDLEPRTIENVGETCQECGVRLTDAELKTALETGGPSLCTIHATEAKPSVLGDEDAEEAGY
jgi:hypothetical protein